LAFIGVFRLSDITMGVMANPFYIDMGFSKADIASVTKVFGLVMTMLGAAAGGVLVVRYGIMRMLLVAAILVAGTNLIFAWLATQGPDIALLALVVSADNLSGGLAGSVFIAYLSSLANRAYTATQYALFSSLMLLPAKFLGGFSGDIVDATDYVFFFSYAATLGVPAILLVLYLTHNRRLASADESSEQVPARERAEETT
jgi:PAT family beta-lactamase induction signal transducer AmpG